MTKKKLAPIKECSKSRVDRYTGIREPRCNAGRGCPSCWEKYRQFQMKARKIARFHALDVECEISRAMEEHVRNERA